MNSESRAVKVTSIRYGSRERMVVEMAEKGVAGGLKRRARADVRRSREWAKERKGTLEATAAEGVLVSKHEGPPRVVETILTMKERIPEQGHSGADGCKEEAYAKCLAVHESLPF